jgi:hypothetical protein
MFKFTLYCLCISYCQYTTIKLYIIFLSNIRSIEDCYGRYKTEFFHLLNGLPKFLFRLGWYFRIILYVYMSL